MKTAWVWTLTIISIFSVEAETLTLEQARELALANSKDLAKYNLTISNSQLAEQADFFSKYLPTLSASANASTSLWNMSSGDSAGGASSNDKVLYDSLTVNGTLTAREQITLYDGGSARIASEIRAISNETTRIQALEAYFSVLTDTDNAYYAVLQAQASLAAAELSLENADLGLAIAEVRLETGIISAGDYLKALIEKETQENSRNQTRRDLSLKQTQLQNIIRLASAQELEPVNFDAYENVLQTLASLSDAEIDTLYTALWKSVESSNPALSRSALSYQQAGKNLESAQSKYLPTVTASASATAGLNWMPSSESFTTSTSGSVSLNVSIPLDVWVTANSVAQQKNNLSSANLTYEASRENTAVSLMSALYTAVQQASAVLSSRRSYELSQQNYDYTMERYKLSQSSTADLTNASLTLTTSHNALNNAQFTFLKSLSAIRSLGAFEEESVIIDMALASKGATVR
ncbi:MAG: TolC family protein [Treponema sp.]|jgi:outer membrane protein TolC|nr:TolC family protein [Treponema sp.]